MLTYHHNGRTFYGEDNTAAPNKTEGGKEKRIVNEIVAKDHKWNFVLDAYAGFGISTPIYSQHAKHVVALEKDKGHFSELEANILYKAENVDLSREDSLDYLKRALKEKNDPPDLIDLDPFNECEKQLHKALKWMKEGVILITNGHIKPISRIFSTTRKKYPGIKNKYIGREAILWPEEYYFKMLLKRYKQLHLVHFYVHQTSVRAVFAVGDFKFKLKTIKALASRPKYLGWNQFSLSLLEKI